MCGSSLAATDDGLRLAAVGNGGGFCSERTGSGLPGLRDRVEAVGGRLEVSSSPGAGTTLVATLPAGNLARA